MNAKEILLKVKALFNDQPAPVALAAKTYKLADGTEVSVQQAGDTVAVGDKVTIAGAPAPAGELALEDGSMWTVDATGTIVSMETSEDTEPVTTDTNQTPAPSMEQRIAAIESELAKLKQPQMMAEQFAKTEVTSELKKQVEKQNKIIEGLFELCEKLVELPASDPKTLSDKDKEKFAKQEKKERAITAIADGIRKIREEKN